MTDTNATEEKKSYAETIGIEPVSLHVAAVIVQLCWYDKHVPLLIGESGIGKTAIMRQLSRFNDYRFELYNLAYMESTDLTGPMYASRTKPDAFTFLRDGRIPFKGFEDENDKALIAADEFNRPFQGGAVSHGSTVPPISLPWTSRRDRCRAAGSRITAPSTPTTAPPSSETAASRWCWTCAGSARRWRRTARALFHSCASP